MSLGTVSNVLNRPDQVSAGSRERVLTAIAELGFVRNESARQLRAGTSRTLGLVVLDIANPFFTDVARGVSEVADAAGLAVILCNSDDRPAKESAYLDLLAEQRVQGVLITPTADLAPHLDSLRAGVCRSCWSTVGATGTVSARSRSTTSSAGAWRPTTSSSGATGGSPSSAGRRGCRRSRSGTRAWSRPSATGGATRTP